jgi:hypothetical protein
MTHLPRGAVRVIAGRRFLSLGGTAYMDAHTTQMGAVIKERDLQRCLRHAPGAVELVITHDAPRGLDIPVAPGFEQREPPGFEGGLALADHLKPRWWFFGHHHCRYEAVRDGTTYYGLPESSEGFCLLLPDDTVSYEENPLPRSPGRLAGWWARLRGLAMKHPARLS